MEADHCVGSFLWYGAAPRLARSTLQLLFRCGGLTWWFIWWFTRLKANAAVCLEGVIIGSLTNLVNFDLSWAQSL